MKLFGDYLFLYSLKGDEDYLFRLQQVQDHRFFTTKTTSGSVKVV